MKKSYQHQNSSLNSQNSTVSFYSTGGKKTLKGNFLKNTFTYKVCDIPVKIIRTQKRKLTIDEMELDRNYQIYSSLKMIQKTPGIETYTQQDTQLKKISKIARYRNEFSMKRLEENKKLEEKVFLVKKTDLMEQNKKSLINDLKSLNRISSSSYTHFKKQINLYNKYYSNYLSEELPLDNYREPTRKIDLNIVQKPYLQFQNEERDNIQSKVEEERYTYKKQLSYVIPDDIFDTKELNKKKKDLKLYNHSVVQFDQTLEKLAENAVLIKNRQNNEMDREFIRSIRRGDEYQVGYQLSVNPDLINATDQTNKSALVWAMKRNNPVIIKKLISRGATLKDQESLILRRSPSQTLQQNSNNEIK